MPFFYIDEIKTVDGFTGLALTIGWIDYIKTFQIALAIGKYTVAFGLDFN